MDFALLAKVFGVSNTQLVKVFQLFGDAASFLEARLSDIQPHIDAPAFTALSAWRQTGRLPEPYLMAKQSLGAADAQTLCWGDRDYPCLLAEIPDPPAVLFIKGSKEHLGRPQIAIVGSRQSTAQGIRLAREFSEQLGRAGFVITSGLALGIDGAAHTGALAAQAGTQAVMGTGIDQIYPARHRGLAEQILFAGGALITEFLPGSPPRANHFPQRNRIVTGLCLGVLVVEAGARSGSLISARLAAEQGREVCVIPGSVLSPVSEGCNQLIREGATLVTRPEQVVEQLGSMLGFQFDHGIDRSSEGLSTQSSKTPDNDYEQNWLLDLISFDPFSVDWLCEISNRPVSEITTALMELEMAGFLSSTAYGYQRLK